MEAAQAQFGNRIWFLGLQGSYGRGEATPESDLDVVLILDTVSASDLQAYSAMLDRLPERERVCGFISGKGELLAWEPSDLFQFCHDTSPLLGTLDEVLEKISRADVCRAVWTLSLIHISIPQLLPAICDICCPTEWPLPGRAAPEPSHGPGGGERSSDPWIEAGLPEP